MLRSVPLYNPVQCAGKLHACTGAAGITFKMARLTLSQKKNHILFQLENPVEKIPAFVDGVPVSTRNGHGIGVRSIIYYVEQLHGQCHFSIVNHCFVLRIII